MTQTPNGARFPDCPPAEGPDNGDARAPIARTASEELDALYRFASARVGGDSHMALDAVQQAIRIALDHAAPPERPSIQRAWLRGIVRNLVRREVRQRSRGRRAIQGLASVRPHQVPPGHNNDDAGERLTLVRTLFLALTELDQSDQELFYAFYRAGRSHAAIAVDLGTSAKSVESRLYRMRARLRAALSQMEGEP